MLIGRATSNSRRRKKKKKETSVENGIPLFTVRVGGGMIISKVMDLYLLFTKIVAVKMFTKFSGFMLANFHEISHH